MNEYNQITGLSGQALGLVFFPLYYFAFRAQAVSVELDSTKKFIFLFNEKKCKVKFKNML